MINEIISYSLIFSGFIIGLGAVTVIDILGFLGRNSRYWTEATIRTHKVTKPLIWIGIILLTLGTIYSGVLLFSHKYFFYLKIIFIIVLILNGLFLSFYVSPYLIRQEKLGKSDKILPFQLQLKITVSFLISVIFWWSLFAINIYELTIK